MSLSPELSKPKKPVLAGVKEAVQEVADQPRRSAVKEAVSRVANLRRSNMSIEPVSPPHTNKAKAILGTQSINPKYQSSTTEQKSVKDTATSLDSVVGKEAPISTPQALEEVASSAPPPQSQNLEAAAADSAGAYARQSAANAPSEDPASFYRNLSGNPASLGGEGTSGFNPRDESAGPLQAYANRSVYQTRTDASTGQKLAALGNEELSLTGAIQKFYQRQ